MSNPFRKRTKGHVWDPRRSHDYQTRLENPCRKVFSSAEHNCVVIEINRFATHQKSSDIQERTIYHTLKATGAHGFFNIYPTRSLSTFDLIKETPPVQYDEAWFGHFDIDMSFISDFLSMMRSRACYEEWIIGSCLQRLDPKDTHLLIDNTKSPQLDYFLYYFDRIGSLWSFNHDSALITIFFKVFDGCDQVINTISQQVKNDM